MTATIDKLVELLFRTMENDEWNEELLYDLSTELTNGLEKILSTQLSGEFCELYDYADSYRRGNNNQDTPEHAFFMGRLYGMLDLIKRKYEELEKEELLSQYDKSKVNIYKILRNIYDNPGIIHDELTKHINGGKSALSQAIKKPETDGLIRTIKSGRQKHYFLTPLGTKVYHRIKPAYEQQITASDEISAVNDFFVVNNNLTDLTINNMIKEIQLEYTNSVEYYEKAFADKVFFWSFMNVENPDERGYGFGKAKKEGIINDTKRNRGYKKAAVGL